jgi:hypothetical protein
MREADEWEEVPGHGDEKIDEARAALRDLFAANRDLVAYHRQLAVQLEGRFFHWITGKALGELASDGQLRAEEVAPRGWKGQPFHFYSNPKNRYWKREALRRAALVSRFSTADFGHALGYQGELMVDAGLGRLGLVEVARNANRYRDRQWTKTGEDLDRIVEAKGVGFGVEVKNTLDYIPRAEMRSKVEMCQELGIVPLFVVRMAPNRGLRKSLGRGSTARTFS